MASINVLFIWEVREELRNYLSEGLRNCSNVKLLFLKDQSEANLIKEAPRVDIIVGWRPSKNLLDKAERVRLFINPGAGIHHHLERFRELRKTRNITLVNGHGNSYFTAQHAVALLLALSNKVIPHHNWMAEGKWRRGDDYGRSIPIRFRNVGFLGYGAVNSKVHRFLSGFDVSFSILKREWSGDEEVPTDTERFVPSQLHEFLEAVDTLFVAVPLTEETRGLIGRKELGLLGSNGLLVTIARGDVIDESALYSSLEEKTITGAAIDVWYNYHPEEDDEGRKFPYSYPFHTLDNVIMSPHRGASPMNDLKRWDEVIENIRRFSEGRTDFLNIVDLARGY
ncbi:MAG: NAD(P)-dependent oxidoreductase [Candidatus Hodarchaeota archaeon]